MLKQIRQTIVSQLWQKFHQASPQVQAITHALSQQGITEPLLDHFAIIDLPGPHSGIPTLTELFTTLGFEVRGEGYLAAKQNGFRWLAECDSDDANATAVLPQIVVADFRPEEMPADVRNIVTHYAAQARPLPLAEIQQHLAAATAGHPEAIASLNTLIQTYLNGRDWPLPTYQEYCLVKAFNELLAWVLIFGRRPNHFTFSVHLLNAFPDLAAFNAFIKHTVGLPLNQDGGEIKGDARAMIAQSSTLGAPMTVSLAGGNISVADTFMEFVWRFAYDSDHQPVRWTDYFNGFIPQHADHVIESLYTDDDVAA